MNPSATLAARLESYTLKFPQEVLMVHAQVEGEADVVVIFKGFSSSLMRPTAYDPEIPTLPAQAVIEHIDRLEGPYQPQAPKYIEQEISAQDFIDKLAALGL